MTAARRLAAIMAVDVVRYFRLMCEDEAGALRAVGEHREGGAYCGLLMRPSRPAAIPPAVTWEA